MVALFSATFCAPSAMAATTETSTKGASFATQDMQRTEITSDLDFESVSAVSPNFSARIVLTDSGGSQVLDVTDSKKNLSNLLDENTLDISDFRTSGDTALDDEYVLKNTENLVLFKSEVSGSSEVIKLKAPEEKRDSNELFVGEEKVETEGADGEALKTIISTKNLAADTAVNTEAAGKATTAESSEEKLTVLKAPQARVVLVGTKERVEVPAAVATPAVNTVESASNVATSYNASTGVAASNTAPATTEASAPPSAVSGSVSGLAIAQVGKAYVWGATGPNAFDCSGLIHYVFSNSGKSVPRTALAQGLASTPISRGNMQPGDIIWTDFHIGVYVGNGKMVHASSPSTGVIMDNVDAYLAQGYKIGRL